MRGCDGLRVFASSDHNRCGISAWLYLWTTSGSEGAELMEIFDELARSRAALLEAIAGLDEDAMERKGIVGEWSVKNVLAHVAAWESWVVQTLPARLETGRTPDALRARVADEDRYNAEEVAEREE